MDNRKKFLLSFFNEDKYDEKEVNGFWLIKSQDGSTGKWYVQVNSPESFKKRQDYLKTHSELSDKENELPF